MLANTSFLALRSSGLEWGRLHTQFSYFCASMLCVCIMGIQPSKISEIEAKPIKWHHFPRAHSFFFPRTIFVRMSAKNIVRTSAKKPPAPTTSAFPSARGERGTVVG
jgi:hypothetical protein